MSVTKAAVKVEWAKIISTLGLTGSTVSSLQAFRKRHEDARKKVFELTSQPSDVDFSYYRSVLKNQKIVDDIEKTLKSFKPITYDVSKQIKTIETFEAKALDNAKLTEGKVSAELADLEKTLQNIESARPFDQLSLDDLHAARPDIEAKVKELVTKGRWDLPGYDEKFGSLVLMVSFEEILRGFNMMDGFHFTLNILTGSNHPVFLDRNIRNCSCQNDESSRRLTTTDYNNCKMRTGIIKIYVIK